MKYFKILIIPVLLIAFLFISCERDDICPGAIPTTPRLIIDLLDASDSDIKKNVFDLLVFGDDNDNPLAPYILQDTDDLILPLRTDDNSTQYSLINKATVDDDGNINGGNEDVIVINYSREQVFVSKACGFKTIFKNVTLTIVDDGDNWMLSRQPLTDNQSIVDETTTHFNITH